MPIEHWLSIQQAIQTCRLCEDQGISHLHVPPAEKCKPQCEPLSPVQLYFVSVAPPWGGAYFWDETNRDAVREGLFRAIEESTGKTIINCRQFRGFRFFLTPSVKCPSENDGKDYHPSRLGIRNCSRFLKDELFAAAPERILALGRIPFQSLCDLFSIKAPKKVADFRNHIWWVRLGSREIPMSGTYFPGNNRHRGFPAIVEDISKILKFRPRSA